MGHGEQLEKSLGGKSKGVGYVGSGNGKREEG
jgi:hypothetical protein